MTVKCELYNDNFQNYKRYNIPRKAQLVVADIPLIEIFTDPGDVVIDPCAGSGSTLRAAYELGRDSYGFEISKEYCRRAKTEMLVDMERQDALEGVQETLFDLMGV